MPSIVPIDPIRAGVRAWRILVANLWRAPTTRAQHRLQRAGVVFCCVVVSSLLNAGSAVDWRFFGLAVAMAIGATMIGHMDDA